MKILVTGGAGYIGSHAVTELLLRNNQVIVFDNLNNSSIKSIERVKKITKKDFLFIKGDLKNINDLNKLFNSNEIDAVMHFAGLKAVHQSVLNPLEYYSNNFYGTLNLLKSMKQFNVSNLIFSSSATVYGKYAKTPYQEEMNLGYSSSPYGSSKIMIEMMLEDEAIANKNFKCVSLRYFNPIGAHHSGEIGDNPKGVPNNLMPFITQVAIGKQKDLIIYGNDYLTADGTCERDYIHISDLVDGHISALDWLINNKNFSGVEIFNLGTGNPISVLEIVKSFEKANEINIPYRFTSRRQGDLPSFWADTRKAKEILGWECKKSLVDMMKDSWNWQCKNPNGY